MIEVRNLVKWYGPTLAVGDISFAIPKGQIVGFLGPNGAGKSTTLKIITGYLPPTSGYAGIDGQNVLTAPEVARARIGYLPEANPLYPEMRVTEYLDYRGRLFEMPRAQRKQRSAYVIERCGLSAVRRRLIGQLSRGNKQRVGLAQALLHDPPVIILDEPTVGLDPNQVLQFRKLIEELKGQHTLLLSTHILPEVEKMADYVIIIAGGRIAAQGSPAELRQQVTSASRVLLEVKAAASNVEKTLRQLPQVLTVDTTTQDGWCRAAVTSRPGADVREAIGQAVTTQGWPLREMRYETAGLEQFFVQITAAQSHNQTAPAAGYLATDKHR